MGIGNLTGLIKEGFREQKQRFHTLDAVKLPKARP
ncbi:hypothetical protein BMS3Abin17_00013 [archaeon BMS3Abin17]|nr:hypothetical protein BMS3Abin17_00013 [archaeon BMS3Abin17]